MPPLLFCRITWMDHYQGITEADQPRSEHGFVKEHKDAHEQFAFLPYQGTYYAYVPIIASGGKDGRITITNLGADPKAEFLDGVDVLFCATRPFEKGSVVVGWYRNARVWRALQELKGRLPKARKEYPYFRIEAKEAHLLPVQERTVDVRFGQSALSYGGKGQERKDLLRRVEALLAGQPDPEVAKRTKAVAKPSNHPRWQQDLEMRLKVEAAAIKRVEDYYIRLGYTLESRENERNVGYDLLATKGTHQLYLEVKGLSGADPVVQLTANEYACMRKYKAKFRLCVVTNALDPQQAQLVQVAWNAKAKAFVADTGAIAEITPKPAAIVRLVGGKEEGN